jgi:hypothetical protein
VKNNFRIPAKFIVNKRKKIYALVVSAQLLALYGWISGIEDAN